MISLDVFEKALPLVAVFLACYVKFNKELGQVSVARHTKVLCQIMPWSRILILVESLLEYALLHWLPFCFR